MRPSDSPIGALVAGKFFGWNWLDPVMGIVGAAVITKWAHGLLKETSGILLDNSVEEQTLRDIVKAIEADKDNRVSDIHIWKVGPEDHAGMISIVTHYPQPTEHYKQLVANVRELAHVTVEVVHCKSTSCISITNSSD